MQCNFYMNTFKKNEVEIVVKSTNESLYLIIFTNITVFFNVISLLFALSYNCCADISTQNYLKDVVMVNKLALCMSILRSNNYICSDSY